jgi:hypothetical protein
MTSIWRKFAYAIAFPVVLLNKLNLLHERQEEILQKMALIYLFFCFFYLVSFGRSRPYKNLSETLSCIISLIKVKIYNIDKIQYLHTYLLFKEYITFPFVRTRNVFFTNWINKKNIGLYKDIFCTISMKFIVV